MNRTPTPKHLKQQTNDGIRTDRERHPRICCLPAFWNRCSRSLRKAATLRRSTILTRKPTRLRRPDASAQSAKPHGILFLGSNPEYFTPELEALGIPCLLLTNSAASLRIRNLSSVSVDDMAASDTMIEYLCKKGTRRIGIIGGKPNLSRQVSPVWPAVRGAMLRLGLPFDMEKHVCVCAVLAFQQRV